MSDEEQGGASLEIGGIKFTGGKMAIVITALTSAVGVMWGGFEVYQQFLTMKEVTAAYVPPDLSGINSRLSVLDERMNSVERLTKSNSEALDYMSSSVTSTVNSTRQSLDQVETRTRASEQDMVTTQRTLLMELRAQDGEQLRRVRELQENVNKQIEKTLANPLAGGEK